MGVCASNLTEEERSAQLRSKSINAQLRKDGKNPSVKLLLLGTGESGKSTILKQMKIIHGEGAEAGAGLSEADKRAQVEVIRGNIMDSIEVLLEAAQEFCHPLDAANKEAEARVRAALEEEGKDRAAQYTELMAADVAALWQDSGVQQCLERKAQLSLLDSAPYFLKKASAVASPDFLPSDEDVLRARSVTTGVVTSGFKLTENGRVLNLELVDVGGQRGERRRWIHCFEGVTAVMFIISLSDYNQTLYEDDTTNRMQESEKLFGEMLNNVFFRETPFIVFFNKVDIFREKLKTESLSVAYKEYTGPQEEEPALKFICNKFTSHNGNRDRDIYSYTTTATDTTLIKNVMGAVQTIIFRRIIGNII